MKTLQVEATFYNPYEIKLVERGEAAEYPTALKRAVAKLLKHPRSWKGKRSIKRVVFAVDLLA